MKNLFQMTFAVLICLCLFSCSSHNINYHLPDVDVEQLDFEVLNDTFLFRDPLDILVCGNYLLVNDPQHPTHMLHVFDKPTGEHIKSLIQRGRGPCEAILLNSVAISPDGTLVAYDPNLNKIIKIPLNDTTQTISEHILSDVSYMVSQVVPLNENRVLLKGTTADMRFAIYDLQAKKVQVIYNQYPQIDKDSETNCSIWDYAVQMSYNAESHILATGTYVGGVLELLQINEQQIAHCTTSYYIPPIFTYASGVYPRYIATTKETMVGFQDILVSDTLVYGLIWNTKKGEMQQNRPKIMTFTPSGIPLSAFSAEDYIFAFAKENDDIYAVMMTVDGEYYLARGVEK